MGEGLGSVELERGGADRGAIILAGVVPHPNKRLAQSRQYCGPLPAGSSLADKLGEAAREGVGTAQVNRLRPDHSAIVSAGRLPHPD